MKNKQPLFKKQFDTWDEWLEFANEELLKKGYSKFVSHSENNCDFYYAKTIKNNEQIKEYQLLIKFYDFRPFAVMGNDGANRIGIMFVCSPFCDSRIDLEVSKDISVKNFEEMAEHFYISMAKYFY